MKCSQCNAELENEGAMFCSKCGCKVSRQISESSDAAAAASPESIPSADANPPADHLDESETLTHDEGAGIQEYRQVLQNAMADGLLDSHDRLALEKARQELRISEGDAAELEEETLDIQCLPTDEHAANAMPLRLEINDNHFYMEKRAGVLDFRLQAVADGDCQFQLRLDGNFLGSHEWKGKLSAGRTARRKFQVVPGIGGEHLIDLTLQAEQDGKPVVWTAQPTLKVLLPDENPTNMTVVFDQRMESGRNIGYGLSIRNEVNEGFAKGLLRNTNDLLRQRFADQWQPLRLLEDSERTIELRQNRLKHVQVVRRAATGEAIDRLALSPDDAAVPMCVLLAKANISIGRKREGNDIVIRKLPRSHANDMLTLQLSGSHVTVSMRDGGLVLTDLNTVNGTTLNGQEVRGEINVPLDQPSELDLAKAFRLRIVPFLESSPLIQADQYADLGQPDDLWRKAEELRLRSLLIMGADESTPVASHLIVLKYIEVGCRPGNEIILPGPCASRHCMRILRLGGRFWLEGLTEENCLSLDDQVISSGHAADLAIATKLHCRYSSWTVCPEGADSGPVSPGKSSHSGGQNREERT